MRPVGDVVTTFNQALKVQPQALARGANSAFQQTLEQVLPQAEGGIVPRPPAGGGEMGVPELQSPLDRESVNYLVQMVQAAMAQANQSWAGTGPVAGGVAPPTGMAGMAGMGALGTMGSLAMGGGGPIPLPLKAAAALSGGVGLLRYLPQSDQVMKQVGGLPRGAAMGEPTQAAMGPQGATSPRSTPATGAAPGGSAANGGEFDAIIRRAAAAHGVDEGLIRAVIQTESSFNPNAVSPAGAQGLMQLMPPTARDLGVSDPFDPEQNIMGGTRYLRQLLDRYQGQRDLALAAYNWGMGNLERNPGAMPSETRNYVARINALMAAG